MEDLSIYNYELNFCYKFKKVNKAINIECNLLFNNKTNYNGLIDFNQRFYDYVETKLDFLSELNNSKIIKRKAFTFKKK